MIAKSAIALSTRPSTKASGIARTLAGVHSSQLASLSDSLINVDQFDNVIGPMPKLDGHLPDAINNRILHRAFSVFMFSTESRSLLIQKRAVAKIVFPREWANTCCSHPLFKPEEMENLGGNQVGIKRAASKRLNAELGIAQRAPESFSFKEKIAYSQLSPGGSFGESEVDYILLSEMGEGTPISPDENEVEAFAWIQPGGKGNRVEHLKEFLETQAREGFPATPWFALMVNEPNCLELWWESLIGEGSKFLSKEDTTGSTVRSFLERK